MRQIIGLRELRGAQNTSCGCAGALLMRPDHATVGVIFACVVSYQIELRKGGWKCSPCGGCTHTHITLCLFKAGGAQVGGGNDAGQGGEAQVVSVGVLGDGVALLSPTRGSDPALAVARRPPCPLRADAPFARPTQVLVPRGGSAGRAEPGRSRRDAVWWRHGWRACDSLHWRGYSAMEARSARSSHCGVCCCGGGTTSPRLEWR